MQIINLRCGRGKQGLRRTPLTKIVEAMVLDSDGRIFFVAISTDHQAEDVFIAKTSMFDILKYLYYIGVDSHEEYLTLESVSIARYSYRIAGSIKETNLGELNINDSNYAGVIKLCNLALEELFADSNPSEADIDRFIAKYLGEDLNCMF